MKILIVGGGGREHALAWKCAQPPYIEKVFCAPGNAGTALEKKVVNAPIEAENIIELAAFAEAENIEKFGCFFLGNNANVGGGQHVVINFQI